MPVKRLHRPRWDARKHAGPDVKHNVRLPLLGCSGLLGYHGINPGLPRQYHDWSLPLNCPSHGYAHLVGVACWRCGRQEFFWSRRCWKTRNDPDADLAKQYRPSATATP